MATCRTVWLLRRYMHSCDSCRWDGSKLTSKDLILRCRDMEAAVGCEKDADGLAVREWFIAQTGESLF